MTTAKRIYPVALAKFKIDEFKLWKSDKLKSWYKTISTKPHNGINGVVSMNTLIENIEIIDNYMYSQGLLYEVLASDGLCTILNHGGKENLIVPSLFVEFIELSKEEHCWDELSYFSDEDVGIMPLSSSSLISNLDNEISKINAQINNNSKNHKQISPGNHPKIIEVSDKINKLKNKLLALKIEMLDIKEELKKGLEDELKDLTNDLGYTEKAKEVILEARYNYLLCNSCLGKFSTLRIGDLSYEHENPIIYSTSLESILSKLILADIDVDRYANIEDLLSDKKIDLNLIFESEKAISVISIPNNGYRRSTIKTSILSRCKLLHANDDCILFRDGEKLSISWVNSSKSETGLSATMKASISRAIFTFDAIGINGSINQLFDSFVPTEKIISSDSSDILSLFKSPNDSVKFNKKGDKVVLLKDFRPTGVELVPLQRFGNGLDIVSAELTAGIYELGKNSTLIVELVNSRGEGMKVPIVFDFYSKSIINLNSITKTQLLNVLESPIYNWNMKLKTNISSCKISELLTEALVEIENMFTMESTIIFINDPNVAAHPFFEKLLVSWKLSTSKRLDNPSSIKHFINYSKKIIKTHKERN